MIWFHLFHHRQPFIRPVHSTRFVDWALLPSINPLRSPKSRLNSWISNSNQSCVLNRQQYEGNDSIFFSLSLCRFVRYFFSIVPSSHDIECETVNAYRYINIHSSPIEYLTSPAQFIHRIPRIMSMSIGWAYYSACYSGFWIWIIIKISQ